jgi:hypothetical protein
MAAGALTGALYKSTGTVISPSFVYVFLNKKLFLISRSKARSCSSNICIGNGWNLELCEEESMIDPCNIYLPNIWLPSEILPSFSITLA